MSGRSTHSSDEAFIMKVERRGWHTLGILSNQPRSNDSKGWV